jgi:hypothetical protein
MAENERNMLDQIMTEEIHHDSRSGEGFVAGLKANLTCPFQVLAPVVHQHTG